MEGETEKWGCIICKKRTWSLPVEKNLIWTFLFLHFFFKGKGAAEEFVCLGLGQPQTLYITGVAIWLEVGLRRWGC